MMAALGSLSTLAELPAPRRTAGGEAHEEAERATRAAWLSALSLAGLGRALGPRPDWEREATGAARSWLRLVDEGRHTASWAAGAPLLREGTSAPEWDTALRAVRAPLGRCLSRTLRSRAAVEGPPGELRGPYVVIRFESRFDRHDGATETVTPVRGADGRWRVAAYFID